MSTMADGSVGRALEATARDAVEARERALRLLGVAATADLGRRLDAAKESLAPSAAGAGDRNQLAWGELGRPRRMRSRVISPNQRSTRLSHELLVGMK